MRSMRSFSWTHLKSRKMVWLWAAGGALVTMGVLAGASSATDVIGVHPVSLIADTPMSPATTPSVASAAPTVKATSFVGGDWPGMGGH
jgi:hypothetical protein